MEQMPVYNQNQGAMSAGAGMRKRSTRTMRGMEGGGRRSVASRAEAEAGSELAPANAEKKGLSVLTVVIVLGAILLGVCVGFYFGGGGKGGDGGDAGAAATATATDRAVEHLVQYESLDEQQKAAYRAMVAHVHDHDDEDEDDDDEHDHRRLKKQSKKAKLAAKQALKQHRKKFSPGRKIVIATDRGPFKDRVGQTATITKFRKKGWLNIKFADGFESSIKQGETTFPPEDQTPPPTPAPTRAAAPDACAPGAFGAHDHSKPLPGQQAPMAWKTMPNSKKRNPNNRFEQRLAKRCCTPKQTTVTLGWAAFLATQPCAAHAPVTIPCGTKVRIDGAELGGKAIELVGLYVEGELEFVDGTDVALKTDFIFNCGTFRIGTPERRHQSKVDITLTGAGPLEGRQSVMWRGSDFGQTGFVTFGGLTYIRAAHCERTTWTRLAAPAQAGATELKLQLADVGTETAWRVGERLLVVTTDNKGPAHAEIVTIAGFGADGRTVRINEALARVHDGCEADGEDQVIPGLPCTLAAEVAPLQRNVVIHGEESCKDVQACGHFVIAHTNKGLVCGAEFHTMGQRTNKGKYPPVNVLQNIFFQIECICILHTAIGGFSFLPRALQFLDKAPPPHGRQRARSRRPE